MLQRLRYRPRNPHPFDLDAPLLTLSAHAEDALWLRDACAGVHAFGATGSGKTSSINRTLTTAYLAAGYGALITTTKPGDRDEYLAFIRDAGRLDDVIIFGADQGYAFNFLQYEAERPGRGAGLTENLVRLFLTVLEVGDDPGNASGSGGRANDRFWQDAMRQLLRNAIDLLRFAGVALSLTAIQDVLNSAPVDAAQAQSDSWRAGSYCWWCLQQADQRKIPPDQRHDLKATARFWLHEFPCQDPKTRANVLQTFGVTADALGRGLFRRLFCEGLNVVPEMCAHGKILLLDLPVKEYGAVARQAQCVLKYCFQQAMERRDVAANPRPVALIIDEADLFLTREDISFLQTARSSRVCTLFLTQSLSGYLHRFGGQAGHHATHALLTNFTTKIFAANCDIETYRYMEELFGKRLTYRANSNVSTPKPEASSPARFGLGSGSSGAGGPQVSAGVNPLFEPVEQGSRLNQLRTGGVANDRRCDTFCFSMGRTWAHTGTPVLPVSFTQAPQ
ncbi:MAG: type IV secretion system DNA-binding domain-containing protein [Planctomycetota bacterium]